MQIVVVVLAGGESSRFGTDKLDASLGLLDELFGGISPEFLQILVGPDRPIAQHRGVRTVREDPPGGGPAAGLVAGLRAARDLAVDADTVALPGDAPGGGLVIAPLIAALATGAYAACPAGEHGLLPLPVAVSPDGRDKLLATAGDGRGQSVRRLLTALRPVPVDLDPAGLFDVDTHADLLLWRQRGEA